MELEVTVLAGTGKNCAGTGRNWEISKKKLERTVQYARRYMKNQDPLSSSLQNPFLRQWSIARVSMARVKLPQKGENPDGKSNTKMPTYLMELR